MSEKEKELQSLLPSEKGGKKAPCCPLQARYVLAAMSFFGFFNVYAMRVNLSVAMVAMVNASDTSGNVSHSEECPENHDHNSTSLYPKKLRGDFYWDEKTQGVILGSFYYGYIATQIPGGWLAGRLGGKRLMAVGVLVTGLLTIVTPWVARLGTTPFIALRILEGLGEGVTFPAMHAMWGEWAPVSERSRLAAFTYAGSMLGTVVAMPVTGILCDMDSMGWPSVFYIFGGVACLWVLLWMVTIHDFPRTHPRISDSEKSYIENSANLSQTTSTPWVNIVLSPALWTIAAAHFANSWGFYTMMTCLPLYMAHVLKFDLKQNGTLSSLPYVIIWVLQMTSGIMADVLRTRRWLSTRNTRKLMNTLGMLPPAVFLALASYAGCDVTLTVVYLTVGLGFSGFCMAGYSVNHLDIAPRFAGTLMGITNSIATIPGFVAPLVVGLLINKNETRAQWRIVFFIASAVYGAGGLIFLLFARGEELFWSRELPKVVPVVRRQSAVPPGTGSEQLSRSPPASPRLHAIQS